MDKLEGETLVNLAELLIKGVKEGHHHALELFPKLLSIISTKKTICYQKGESDAIFFALPVVTTVSTHPPREWE